MPCGNLRPIPLAPSLVIWEKSPRPTWLHLLCGAVEGLSGRAVRSQPRPRNRNAPADPAGPCPPLTLAQAPGTRGHGARCRAALSTRSVEHHVHLGGARPSPHPQPGRTLRRRAGAGLCQGAPEVPPRPLRGSSRAGAGAGLPQRLPLRARGERPGGRRRGRPGAGRVPPRTHRGAGEGGGTLVMPTPTTNTRRCMMATAAGQTDCAR